VEGYQFFANITTNDAAGDAIRAVVAETLNTRALNGVGVNIYNNPDPRLKIYQSQAQNVSLTTYLSQNK
jgi:citrate synthase